MRLPVRFPIATMVLAFCSATASAQWRCDCTTIVDSCTAEVSIQPNWVDVRTDDAQCSRVDYFIDGLPFVTLVVEGEARQDWIATAGDARVVVQSCQVCRDLAESSPLEATANGEAPEAGPLEPLVMVTATYPVDAQKRGLEGFVEVEFTVTPFGDVQQARVTNAEPAGVFERAALSAVSRWRYPPDESRESLTRTERLDFTLEDFIWNDATATRTSSGVSGSMNSCVRESVEYNFGEMIEVGLMNTCANSLIVFACAQGVGAHANRWVCADSETQRRVLLRPGDSRTGTRTQIDVPTGSPLFDYVADFYLTRAPNSEYWWVACLTDDETCRALGRQWKNAVDRQSAVLNPRQSTNLAVSRSY